MFADFEVDWRLDAKPQRVVGMNGTVEVIMDVAIVNLKGQRIPIHTDRVDLAEYLIKIHNAALELKRAETNAPHGKRGRPTKKAAEARKQAARAKKSLLQAAGGSTEEQTQKTS